jgi:hypothetical protein
MGEGGEELSFRFLIYDFRPACRQAGFRHERNSMRIFIGLVLACMAAVVSVTLAGEPAAMPAAVPAARPAVASASRLAGPDEILAPEFGEGLAARWNPAGGKIGFIDKTGRWVIQPMFDRCLGKFAGGLALVEHAPDRAPRDRFFIDHTGRRVEVSHVDPQGRQFDYHSCFIEGLAVVYFGGEVDCYGYADRQGRIVIPPVFNLAQPFSEGVALVGGPARVRMGDRPENIEGASEVATFFIDHAGKTVIAMENQWGGWRGGFFDGLAAACDTKTLKWGFIGHDGKWAIEPKFLEVKNFSEGRAAVVTEAGWETGGAYIDTTGKVVIEPQFRWGGPFRCGLARVSVMNPEKKWLWGYIDTRGQWAIPARLEESYPGDFSEGVAHRGNPVKGSWGYDFHGEVQDDSYIGPDGKPAITFKP